MNAFHGLNQDRILGRTEKADKGPQMSLGAPSPGFDATAENFPFLWRDAMSDEDHSQSRETLHVEGDAQSTNSKRILKVF